MTQRNNLVIKRIRIFQRIFGVKKKIEKKGKYVDLARGSKKRKEKKTNCALCESDGDTSCI